jgi:hypothetical protein
MKTNGALALEIPNPTLELALEIPNPTLEFLACRAQNTSKHCQASAA